MVSLLVQSSARHKANRRRLTAQRTSTWTLSSFRDRGPLEHRDMSFLFEYTHLGTGCGLLPHTAHVGHTAEGPALLSSGQVCADVEGGDLAVSDSLRDGSGMPMSQALPVTPLLEHHHSQRRGGEGFGPQHSCALSQTSLGCPTPGRSYLCNQEVNALFAALNQWDRS